ncbi:MAG: helix-turn-helix transcriptional regulator [Oligoflexia bacterium]|nr:helix-turn-helix transcriptional regulator [Oligoflexia bacterium]
MDDNEIKVRFAEVLKTKLHETEMTQKQIANLLKVSEASVSSWLSGTATPSDLIVIHRCSKIFGISFFEMCFGKGAIDGQLEGDLNKKFEEIAAGKWEVTINLKPTK